MYIDTPEYYQANREKIAAAREAGLPVLDYCDHGCCGLCETADFDTQTSPDDDFCTVICHNPECPQLAKARGEDRE